MNKCFLQMGIKFFAHGHAQCVTVKPAGPVEQGGKCKWVAGQRQEVATVGTTAARVAGQQQPVGRYVTDVADVVVAARVVATVD